MFASTLNFDYSGSGSVRESGNVSESGTESNSNFTFLFIVACLSPVICFCLAMTLSCLQCIGTEIKKRVIYKKNEYVLKQIEKKKNIVDGKLSNKYIKTLNANNLTDKIKQNMDTCAICIEQINLNEKIVTLLCGHTFHTKCLQQWVKKQTSQYNNPSCPLDRTVIIEIPKVSYNDEWYSSDSNSDYN